MTLYHVSTLPIEHPLANAKRADQDFGKGFYLTSLHSHQICLLNQELIDRHLCYVNSFLLTFKQKKSSYERIGTLAKNKPHRRAIGKAFVSPERALGIFYSTHTCAMLYDNRYGLHLMGDFYILNNILQELQEKQS